jgi:hypothetical protein
LFNPKKKVPLKKYLLFIRYSGEDDFRLASESDTLKEARHQLKLEKETDKVPEHKIVFGFQRKGIDKFLIGSTVSSFSREDMKDIAKFKM